IRRAASRLRRVLDHPERVQPWRRSSRRPRFVVRKRVLRRDGGARAQNQSIYLNTFFEGGNVWNKPREFDPTRLFRSAGFGVATLSPLGPLGVDVGYGFDKVDATGRPAPSWKLHFKLGQFF